MRTPRICFNICSNTFTKVRASIISSTKIIVILNFFVSAPDYAWYHIRNSDAEPVDEIEEYWNGRYLSAGEGAWRILGFNITKKEPSVTAISIHLENNSSHNQYLRNNNTSTMSSLNRYFVRPLGIFFYDGTERYFKDLTYCEYFTLFHITKYDRRQDNNPSYYIEQPNHDGSPPMHVILRNSRFRHFAHMREVPPSRGEVFYLRTILQHRAASSFLDARTVNGTTYNTYQETTTALGVFADETEAEYALREADRILLKTPRQLRFLFADLLINDCISQPLYIWEMFQHRFCLDFILRQQDAPQIGIDLALQELGRSLEEHGKRLSNYGLPNPRSHGSEVEYERRRWGQNPDVLAGHAEINRLKLNSEQREIYEEILSAVINQSSPSLIFVDGQAGTGKTFLVNILCDKLRSIGLIVLPTATAGYAAQHYPGGRTTHSTFKVWFLLI